MNSQIKSFIDDDGKSWNNIGAELLIFNGHQLIYFTQNGDKDYLSIEESSFGAVSGRGNYGVFTYTEDEQATNMTGPIPEGEYYIEPQGIQYYDNLNTIQKIKSIFGLGTFPGGIQSWGKERVWIMPSSISITNPTTGKKITRSNLSIHGGGKAGSAGCIDLYVNAPPFFSKLKNSSAKRIRLSVQYEKGIKVVL